MQIEHSSRHENPDASSPPRSATAQPIYFRSGKQSVFGWLHSGGRQPAARIGMVICRPFGYEAICSHQSLRAFAETVAAIGVPTLQFDYRGTGDSEDIDPETDQLDAWSRDVVAAIEELQRRTGVERVCLLGFRLGALIAAQVAVRCAAVASLIAVAPIISGRRYLREMRTQSLAAGRAGGAAADGMRGIEVSGFPLSAATVATLSGLDLAQLDLRAEVETLVVDRTESPGAHAWADALTARAARLQYVALPGFVRMMMTAPHLALIPRAMIVVVRDWMARLAGADAGQSAASGHDIPSNDSEPDAPSISLAATNPATLLTETAVRLPGEAGVFGIFTAPPAGEMRRRSIILVNAGGTHHVGPNRLYVTLARRWAERGYLVLRVDLAGLGDSALAKDRAANDVYPATALDGIRAAIEYIRSRYAINNIALGGLCSGAYHALRAAAANLPVTRILLVNPLNFSEHQPKSPDDLQWLEWVHDPKRYLRQVMPSRSLQRLLGGQVDVRQVIKLYGGYGFELLLSLVRDAARALHVPLPRDLGRELEAIAARGIEVVFVFADGDPGIAVLRHQGGSTHKRLGQSCRIRTIDGADHVFSQSAPRAALESILSQELFAPAVHSPRVVSRPDVQFIKQEQLG